MRVRVGNTDAEGRMVMADVLCKFKELVCKVNFKGSIQSIKVSVWCYKTFFMLNSTEL